MSNVEVVQEDVADDRRRGVQDYPVVTDRNLKGYQPQRDSAGRRLFDRFSVTDIGWVSSLVAEGIRKFRGRRPFNENPAKPVEMSEQARLIIVGDWGSGIPRAQKVGTAMRMLVQQSLEAHRDVHVIHLGDCLASAPVRQI